MTNGVDSVLFQLRRKFMWKTIARERIGYQDNIVKETGPISFQVKLEDGKTICCHQGQLRQHYNDIDIEDKGTPLLDDDDLTMFPNSFTPPDVTVDSSSDIVKRYYPSSIRRPPNCYIEESDT